ncbi:hypothetical protein MTR_5g012140 [Medicago truncatula]|uniref:Uncharacterized protein n=1 Tax=Medicago truncatula TaxID=3880 RepID=G7JVZ7_MEDTR|nr:hypothetical protein MTR_5g012140 [Medicago truncatula]
MAGEWRLMTNHDSLVVRLYKTRYYPRCNFFESTFGLKSILLARTTTTNPLLRKHLQQLSLKNLTALSFEINKLPVTFLKETGELWKLEILPL